LLFPEVFIVVGKNDRPIYELEYDPKKVANTPSTPMVDNQLNQFVIHAALDVVDEMMWKNPVMYLKVVDQYKNLSVSSFVSPGNVKFMLLHAQKSEEAIKTFFTDAHELYLKILMNPFYEVNTPITSKVFDDRIKALVQRKLL